MCLSPLKNRFHGAISAFCSARCRRNCAREEKTFVVVVIESERENRDNRTIVLSLFGRMSSCCYVTIVYSNPLVQLPRALFISSLRYPLCNRFALLWQALTGLWLWCGPVKHTDQSSPPFFFSFYQTIQFTKREINRHPPRLFREISNVQVSFINATKSFYWNFSKFHKIYTTNSFILSIKNRKVKKKKTEIIRNNFQKFCHPRFLFPLRNQSSDYESPTSKD